MTTQKLAVLQTKYDGLRTAYAGFTGGMFEHYNLVAKMGAIRREIAELTAPRTVVDHDGTLEGRLIAAGVKFTVDMIQVGGQWVAEITVGQVQ